tara:strand:- start:717 stop:983 length:267 start_codon:yes stop_codon:yes gene_type:complete
MTIEMTKSMTPEQLEKAKDNYANLIVDGMDMDDLWTFAVETLLHNMEMWDEQDLKEEVLDLYDEEIWEDLTEGTTINVTYGEEMRPAS